MTDFVNGDQVTMNNTQNRFSKNEEMKRWIRDKTVLEIVQNGNGLVRVRPLGGGNIWVCEPRNLDREGETQRLTVPAPTAIRLAKEKLSSATDSGSNGEAILVSNIRGASNNIQTGPCHGFARDAGTKHTVGIVTRIVRKRGSYQDRQGILTREELVHYYDFLMNRSPWSQVYMHKSAEQAVKQGVLTVRTDQPGNMVQGALIATRHTWEYSLNVKLFCRLTQEFGCDEHVSYILAFMMSYNGNDKMVAMAGNENDHLSFSPYNMTKEGYEAFFSHQPLVTTDPYNRGGRPGGVKAAWEGKGNALRGQFKTLFNSFGTTRKSFNPFVKAKTRTEEGTRRMSVAEAATFVNHIQSIMAQD